MAAAEALCADAAAITFQVPPGLAERFRFAAGQWVSIRRTVDGREQRRSYSICSPAGGPLRIGVRELRRGGALSPWLVRHVRAGDVLEVGEPAGAFGAGIPTGRSLFVAAGSGITPVLSVVASRLPDPRSRVRLICVNRGPDTEMFGAELDRLAEAYPDRFELVRVWTRGAGATRPAPEDWRRLLAAGGSLPGLTGAWLCGPHALLGDVRAALAALGLPGRRVRTELFDVPEPDVDPMPGVSAVTTVAHGVATTVTVPRSTWLLDAARAVRTDVPFSCTGGMCGACRALVRSGEVDMVANHYLGAGDVARGYVLTCRARPAGATVAVDFDA